MPSLHQKNCISCSLSLTAATDVECTVQFSFYLIFLGFFFEFLFDLRKSNNLLIAFILQYIPTYSNTSIKL